MRPYANQSNSAGYLLSNQHMAGMSTERPASHQQTMMNTTGNSQPFQAQLLTAATPGTAGAAAAAAHARGCK